MENLHRLQTECSYGANLPIPTKQIQNNAKSTQDKTNTHKNKKLRRSDLLQKHIDNTKSEQYKINKAPEEHPICRANPHKDNKLRRSDLLQKHTKSKHRRKTIY